MKKITSIEIEGKKYPLSFSLGASKKIALRLGDLVHIDKILGTGVIDDKIIDNLTYMLAILSAQGAAYMNVYGKDLPVEEGMAYDSKTKKYLALTQEEFEMLLGFDEMDKILTAVTTCMGVGSSTEIELEDNEKNAEAPKVS